MTKSTNKKRAITILDAIDDSNLFARWFRDPSTWSAWRAFLAGLFALPMTAEQLATYQRCTGRTAPPTAPATEGWLVCGRRAGKSIMLALIAVYLATFHDYRRHLAPGERGTIIIIATNRQQARTIFRYIRALLTQVPMLARMIQRESSDSFDLANYITIEVNSASYKSVRGYTVVAALLDELAFWPTDDAAEPDFAIIQALRPGMSTIPNAMLLCASSPYAKKGALWDAHRRHFGKDGPILVWQADTRSMNPTVPQRVIDEAMERDPASAMAEHGAQFRSDVESFVSREAVENCVAPGLIERAPMPGISYSAGVDPSGGSGTDSMTLCIGHKEGDVAIIDAIRERRPHFSPEDCVAEFCELLKTYRITKVVGDKFAGEWPRERFDVHGVKYEPSAKPKSDLYRDLLPAVNSRKVELLDNSRLIAQLVGLERRTARGGRDSIDHAPGSHDDVCNCVAVLVAALATGGYVSDLSWVITDEEQAQMEKSRPLSMHPMFGGCWWEG